MADSTRRFVPGVNFTTLCELKLARGLSHLRELESIVGQWNAQGWLSAIPVQVDMTRIEYRLDRIERPPLDDWSLALGDALHNFRSALDAAAWHVACLDGAKPADKARIYFPVVADVKDWNAQVGPIAKTAPAELIPRFEYAQRWNQPATSNFWLDDLNQLDIDDKHKGLLRASASGGAIVIGDQLEIGDAAHDEVKVVSEMPIQGAHLELGATVFSLHADGPIRLLSANPAPVSASPTVEVRGKTYNAVEFCVQLGKGVRFALNAVYGGREFAIANTDPHP